MIQTYVIGGMGEKKSNGGTQYFQQDIENIVINDRGFIDSTIQVTMGICPSLRAETHGNLPKIIEKIGKS